mmetsp:Transcript_19133/g.73184  ORF Transcript_19133/g.73184 Transcript_19133/m.73184 type:complete len:208 (-) Transcript_19133:157-780(-)
MQLPPPPPRRHWSCRRLRRRQLAPPSACLLGQGPRFHGRLCQMVVPPGASRPLQAHPIARFRAEGRSLWRGRWVSWRARRQRAGQRNDSGLRPGLATPQPRLPLPLPPPPLPLSSLPASPAERVPELSTAASAERAADSTAVWRSICAALALPAQIFPDTLRAKKADDGPPDTPISKPSPGPTPQCRGSVATTFCASVFARTSAHTG